MWFKIEKKMEYYIKKSNHLQCECYTTAKNYYYNWELKKWLSEWERSISQQPIIKHFDCWSQVPPLYMNNTSQVGWEPEFWTILCIVKADLPGNFFFFTFRIHKPVLENKSLFCLPSRFLSLCICMTPQLSIFSCSLSNTVIGRSWQFVWIGKKYFCCHVKRNE